MAMGIKWRTTFMSVGNTKYIVDIYKDGWTGSVTELTPATDALTIEEEDDSDLLTVIRYKTGYVSVMADDNTDVADIFPTGILDRPVRVTEVVGSTQRVIFHGYVQVQEFNRYGNYATTGNPPDVVQIPVISPLGLIYDIEFDKVTTPQDYTLLAVLKTALNKIRPYTLYTYAYVPNIVSGTSWTGTILKLLKTSSLVINPFSDDNIHTSGLTVADCFQTTSVGYFIEGLCRCFGFMVHETEDSVVFTRVDHVDSYIRYNVQTFAETTVSAPSGYTLAPTEVMADGIDITQIAPLRKLTCSYDGDRDTELKMSFQHCKRYMGTNNYDRKYIVCNNPVLSTEWIVPYLETSCVINAANGCPNRKGVFLLAMGEDSLDEMVLVNYRGGDAGHTWATGDIIAKYKFYGYFGTDMTLSMEFKWGGNINLDSGTTTVSNHIDLMITNGSKYYNFNLSNPQWTTTPTVYPLYIGITRLSFKLPSAGMETVPVMVTITEADMRNSDALRLYAITKMTLSGKDDNPAQKYINEGSNPGEYVLEGSGIDDEDISIAFACYGQKNSHMLFPPVSFAQPRYPYMFNRRQQVRVTFRGRMRDYADYLAYMRTVTWKGTGMRLIAASYSADSEQTTMILQTI